MTPLPHHYEVRLAGRATGYATLRAAGLPDLRMAPPVDYDGPGDAWSPEHLLLASVQSCFLFTLRAVARAAKVEFIELELDAEGIVDRQDGVVRFTDIVLRPRLTVPAGADRHPLIGVLEKAKKHCLVSASLSTPLRMEPEITEAEAPALTFASL